VASARSRRSAIIGGLVVVGVALLIVVSGSLVGGLKSAGRVVVAPFAWTINAVARPVANLFSGAVNYSDVVHQNQQLRAELGRAQMQVSEQQALRQQLAQLTNALHLPFVGNVPTLVAQVTTNSPTNFAATITISKGTGDGVLVGMPIVANGGLIGRVISVTNHSATVQLITDQDSVVGATFGTGHQDVLVFGRGVNNPLGVSAITLATALAPGTVFSTNGLQGGLFPPGIPVAKVATATLTPGAATWDLSLTPTADLAHLHYVDVMLWEPST
jgi:rod shape-determining protein MreC